MGMIDYGKGPDQNEIELSVFGPGYGEAIAAHLGDGCWILIDSCIDPDSKLPATLNYLNKINVPPSSVQSIIASHWHDDHVRGISKLAEDCTNSEFFLSGVFNSQELLKFILAHSPDEGPSQTGGTKELVAVIKSKKKVLFANQRSNILQKNILGRQILVNAFSPTQNAQASMLASLASYIPTFSAPINHAPDLSPNLSSIVVHIDFGDDAILLGSDMEDHNIGWRGILDQQWCLDKTKASAYKVAHHGSITGHHDGVWSDLLLGKPISVMTPFIRGNVGIPTDQDKVRIKEKSLSSFISSVASKRPEMEISVFKRLASITTQLSKVNSGFGCVRLRKQIGCQNWNIELFGHAQSL